MVTIAPIIETTWARRLGLIVGSWTALAIFLSAHMMLRLVDLTRLQGLPISVILFAPLFAFSLCRLRALLQRELLPLTVLLLTLTLECTRSSRPLDIAHSVHIYLTSLAFLAVIATSRAFLVASVFVSTILCALLPLYIVATGGEFEVFGFFEQIFVMFGAAHLKGRLPKRSIWLFAEVVLSTYRAASIGLAAGLLMLAIRRPALRVCALVSLVVVGLMLSEYDSTSASVIVSDRSDIYGRFRSMATDGGSGRKEIWTAIAEDLLSRGLDATVVFGHGPPDVDYYIGPLLPDYSIEQRSERCLNSHHVALQIFLGIGLIAIPLLGWMVTSIARGFGADRCVFPFAVTLGIISNANNMFDLSGSSACIALLFVMTRQRLSPNDSPAVQYTNPNPLQPDLNPDLYARHDEIRNTQSA
jgi:hypothetical protein